MRKFLPFRDRSCFLGHKKKKNFFEGWYYKLVAKGGKNRLAIIPGIFLGQDEIRSHAFIMILTEGEEKKSYYLRYPREAFWASRNYFQVQIGPNLFQKDGVDLKINRPEVNLQGSLEFSQIKPWPQKLFSPGVMGWYGCIPFMHCYHEILSFDHEIIGNLRLNDKKICFSDGRGYMEKNWGRSFPQGWVWLQSNHFSTKNTSLVAAVAQVPWVGSSFRGFFTTLYQEGKNYLFATYNGSHICKLIEKQKGFLIHLEKPRAGLHLKIWSKKGNSGSLKSPHGSDMQSGVKEGLNGEVYLKLSKKNRPLFQEHGKWAGIEVGGEYKKLLKN